MCGICCIFFRKNVENATATNTNLLEIFELFKKNIIRRGPDSLGIEQLTCNNNQLLFAASVLWLQGSANTIQPLKSDNSLFIYNGDIFEGFTKKSNCTTSDTTILFELLNRTDNIPSELRKLQGPYAFVYLKNKDQLYFGRDPFGRKSLLLGRNGNMIILSSVARKTANFEFIELPSIGTFCWDLRTDKLSVSANNSPNLHSKLSEVERFLQKKIVCNVASHSETLKFLEPSPHIANLYKELPIVEIGKAFSVILKDPDWLNKVIRLKILLEKSLYRRISTIPKYCKNCIGSQISCSHPLVGILFSGGIDCSILALLADKFIERSRPIDLFNVAFDEVNSFKTPDRQSGLETLEELRQLCPKREWRFVEINVLQKSLDEARQLYIADLIHPLKSVLDDSLGCALWFASKGQQDQNSCRVLLVGMGADELFGGYMKHRAAFKKKSWLGLHNILQEDWQNLPYRNHARDDRVVSDHGCQLRMPYLDENVVDFVHNLQCWEKSYPSDEVAQGFGDKILLRSLAHHIGLCKTALLRKRALQFGSRIANKREKAHEISNKLC